MGLFDSFPDAAPQSGASPFQGIPEAGKGLFANFPEADNSVPGGSIVRGVADAVKGANVLGMEAGAVSPETGASWMQWAEGLKQYVPVPPEHKVAAEQFAAIEEKHKNSSWFNPSWLTDRLAWVAQNPGAAASAVGESAGSSVGPMATGLGGAVAGTAAAGPAGGIAGLVGGTFAGSTAQGYADTLQDFMKDRGLDPQKAESWEQLYTDEATYNEASLYAAKKGVAQGAFDTLTAFLGAKGAGRFVTNKLFRGAAGDLAAPGTARTLSEFGVDTAIEGAGGATGYATGQLATGEPVSGNEAFMEFMGEFGSGAPFAGAEVALDRMGQTRSSPATLEQIAAASQGSTSGGKPQIPPELQQPLTSYDDAEKQGRTWFGVASKGGKVESLASQDYGTTEQNYSQRTNNDPNSYMVAGGVDDVTELAGAVESAVMAGEPVAARSVNPQFSTEQFLTQLQNPPTDKSFKEFYSQLAEQGLRVTPESKVATFVGNAYERRIMPLLEAPIDMRSIGFTSPASTAIPLHPEHAIDLNKVVKSKDYYVSTSWHVFQDVPPAGRAADAFIVHDPGLKQIVESQGWEGLWKYVAKLAGPSAMDQAQGLQPFVDELFASGKLEVKPNAAVWHGYMRQSVNYPYLRVVSREEKSAAELQNDMADYYSQYQPTSSTMARTEGRSAFQGSSFGQTFSFSLNTIGTVSGAQYQDTVAVTYGVGISAKQKQTVEAFLLLIKQMNKKLGTEKLHIFLASGVDDPNIQKVFGAVIPPSKLINHAFFVDQRTGEHIISIEDKFGESTGLSSVLMHEYGHSISAAMMARAPFETQAMIMAAYRRFIMTKQRMSGTERENFQQRKLSRSDNLSRGSQDYYTGFEEWFAQQVARWSHNNLVPMSVVAKFFRKVAREIRGFVKQAKARLGIAYLGAEPEVTAYLNSVVQNKDRINWGAAVQSIVTAKAKVINAKQGMTVPVQSESLPNIQMLEKFAVAQGLGPMPVNTTNPAMNAAGLLAVTRSHSDHFNRLYKWGINFRQLASLNPDNQELQLYVGLIEEMQLEAAKIMSGAETRLKAMKALGRRKDSVTGISQAEYLNRFLFEMNDMNYLTATERAAGVTRWPTQAEFQALAQKHRLSPEALTVYQDVRKDFLQVIDRTQFLALEEAARVYNDPAQFRQTALDIQRDTAKMKKAPYFPQTRFGTWAVTVRNANGGLELFETYESEREQQQAAKEATAHYSGMSVVTSVLPEDVQPFQGMPGWFLDKMASLPGMTKTQQDWLAQLRFELAPQQSFRKHFLRRKGVEGYSREGQRVYAKYFFHHARSYSRLKYQSRVNLVLASAASGHSQAAVPGQMVNENKASGIANYMQNHYNEVMNPTRDWSFFRSLIAVMHLGFNVSAAALNLSQVPVMTQSYLGSKFGDIKSALALTSAGKDLTTYYKRGSYKGMSGGEMKAMAWFVERNLITESMAAELASLSAGGHILPAGFATNALQQGWMWFTEKAMFGFQMVEQVNRRVTARASYRLAMEDYGNPLVTEMKKLQFPLFQDLIGQGFTEREANAILFAKQTLDETQYNYDKVSRPRFMRGKAGVLFAFYNFTQNTVFTLMNPKNKGIMIRYTLIMFALAGAKGLVPDDAEDILNWIGRQVVGKDFDLERETRQFLSSVLSPENSDLAVHGLGRYGFGIPWLMNMPGVDWMPEVDRSQNIAMSRVLPLPLTKLLELDIKPWDKALVENSPQFAGAGWSYALNALALLGNDQLDWGDSKRYDRVMPTALKNMTQAWRMWKEGGIRDSSYNIALEIDSSDPQQMGEIIAKGLGYNPTRLSQYYDAQNAKYEMQAFWAMKREHLLDRAYKAKFFYKDDTEWKAALEEIKSFNRGAPDSKLHITGKTLKRSAEMRQQRGAEKRAGFDPGISPAITQEVQRLYPGAIQVKKVKEPAVGQGG